MFEAYLTRGMDPSSAWLVYIGFLLLGVSWGVALAAGFYASFSLYGWPNGSDGRPITHGIMSIPLILIAPPLAWGSIVGFYFVYVGVELLGDRFPFYKRFTDYCDRAAADWYKKEGDGYKAPPAWLLFLA
ncbi:hypothetical protein G6L37_02905 [Agrobacterium rubi]|nr:hypothetical protein [Agrobacterium rubi]NTF24327.1 hypothetical protein [Agrobacterium rubi]